MPDDEPFEYLATQAIADFLATELSVPVDGIVFPSVQAAGDVLNVVLFHKSSRVEAVHIPKGTEISARTGQFGEDGWEDDYTVIEEVPPASQEAKKEEDDNGWPTFHAIATVRWRETDAELRAATLRIVPDSLKVHRVRRVEFETEEFSVRRHRWEKRDFDF